MLPGAVKATAAAVEDDDGGGIRAEANECDGFGLRVVDEEILSTGDEIGGRTRQVMRADWIGGHSGLLLYVSLAKEGGLI